MIQASFTLDLGTHGLLALVHLVCERCDNNFFITAMPENEPTCCPYCCELIRVIQELDGTIRELDPGI